jgi:hypothetical protein
MKKTDKTHNRGIYIPSSSPDSKYRLVLPPCTTKGPLNSLCSHPSGHAVIVTERFLNCYYTEESMLFRIYIFKKLLDQ